MKITQTLQRLAQLTAVALLLIGGDCANAETEKILNIYNWAEYIGDNTVKEFEAETGIKVRYDNFDSNETLLAKMIAGRSGYDIVVPSSDFGRIMVEGGVVQRIDRKSLTNWGNLDPVVMQLMSKLDPGNQYMVPWLGSTVSVGYNVEKVKAALAGMPMPANPFDLVFNPTYTSRLKKCGISYLDTASDVFPSALLYLGRKAYSNNVADYNEAFNLMQKVRQDISLFSYNGYIGDLASGNICVALGYGGDFNNAKRQANAMGRGVQIDAPLPEGGVQFGFESMMIPSDAPHPENALLWINFILRAKIQAEITNKVMFTSPNLAARQFISADVLSNAIAFPPAEYLATKAQFYELRRNDTRRVMTRLFTKLKSGL